MQCIWDESSVHRWFRHHCSWDSLSDTKKSSCRGSKVRKPFLSFPHATVQWGKDTISLNSNCEQNKYKQNYYKLNTKSAGSEAWQCRGSQPLGLTYTQFPANTFCNCLLLYGHNQHICEDWSIPGSKMMYSLLIEWASLIRTSGKL